MSQLPSRQRRTSQPAEAPRTTPQRASQTQERPTPKRQSAQAQPAQRTSTQRSSTQRPPQSRNNTGQRRPVQGQRYSQNSRYRQQPPPRDPFPIVIGAIVFAGLVSIVLIFLLLGNNNNANPQVAGGAVSTSLPNTGGGVMTQPTSNGVLPTTNASTDLPGTPMPNEGNQHVAANTNITYQNYPPSSGTHYDATAEYGFSDKEIPEGQIVHSMEHGAIVLYYKPDLPQATKDELKKAYDQLPASKYGKVKMVIAPYTQMQAPMTLAAWTRLLPMNEYNYQTVFDFYRALVDKGPEDVP